MKVGGSLNQSTRFTSVGYGFLGFTTGPAAPMPVRDQVGHYVVGSFDALAPDQLRRGRGSGDADVSAV